MRRIDRPAVRALLLDAWSGGAGAVAASHRQRARQGPPPSGPYHAIRTLLCKGLLLLFPPAHATVLAGVDTLHPRLTDPVTGFGPGAAARLPADSRTQSASYEPPGAQTRRVASGSHAQIGYRRGRAASIPLAGAGSDRLEAITRMPARSRGQMSSPPRNARLTTEHFLSVRSDRCFCTHGVFVSRPQRTQRKPARSALIKFSDAIPWFGYSSPRDELRTDGHCFRTRRAHRSAGERGT
jgi:hypothetical protein